MITSPTALVTTVTGVIEGNSYIFRLSTKCADGSDIFDDQTVFILSFVTANAGTNQVVCPGAGTLAGSTFGGSTGNWAVQGTNSAGITIADPSSPTSSYTAANSSAGVSTLRWTVTTGSGKTACESWSEMTITNRGGVVTVYAGNDQTLSNCYSLFQNTSLNGHFDGNNIGEQTGLWTVVSDPNIPTFADATVHNTWVSNLITV